MPMPNNPSSTTVTMMGESQSLKSESSIVFEIDCEANNDHRPHRQKTMPQNSSNSFHQTLSSSRHSPPINQEKDDDEDTDVVLEGKEQDQDGENYDASDIRHLTQKESRSVAVWKCLTLFLIVAAGIGVSYMTYVFLSSEEHDNHEEAFEQFTNTMKDITKIRSNNLVVGLQNFASILTGYAQRPQSNVTWPKVTLPNFEIQAETAREQTQVEFLLFAPLVTHEDRFAYEAYTRQNQWWIEESRNITLKKQGTLVETSDYVTDEEIPGYISQNINSGQRGNGTYVPIPNVTDRHYIPVWQVSPPPFTPRLIGSDANNGNINGPLLHAVNTTRDSAMGIVFDTSFLADYSISTKAHEEYHASLVLGDTPPYDRPHAIMLTPIFEILGDPNSDIVGVVISVITFDAYVSKLLPNTVKTIDLVVKSTCFGQVFTYRIDGTETVFVGYDDSHDPQFNDSEVSWSFHSFLDPELSSTTFGHCIYTFNAYPTAAFVESYESNLPLIFAFVVAAIFCLLIVVFVVYDKMGTRRNAKVENVAARSNTIVSQLFPKQITSKLIEDVDYLTNKATIPEDEVVTCARTTEIKQVADLYPVATILFAGISNFDEWSSRREPLQIFNLLEALFGAFNTIASRRGVFKVETIGELYVAVANVPEANPRHAILMTKFASDCLHKSVEVFHHLDPAVVGEGAQDLKLQIGLHTGPVCGGVLRGQRSRFQLFGDSVSVASRMQRTSRPGMIHSSKTTSDALCHLGMKSWVRKRQSIGDGPNECHDDNDLGTYWLHVKTPGSVSSLSSASIVQTSGPAVQSAEDLENWHEKEMKRILMRVLALEGGQALLELDEMDTPFFGVSIQMEEFVTSLRVIHLPNSFHNLEHASFMAQYMSQLQQGLQQKLDPMAELACWISCWIVNIGHPGVSNEDLSNSKKPVLTTYRGKSLVQHQAFQSAWDIFLQEDYEDLRTVLCPTSVSLTNFEKNVLACVTSTDVLNSSLSASRKSRWEVSNFDASSRSTSAGVLEDLMLAAYLSHFFQSTHIFLEWNLDGFSEMYVAFLSGRSDKDPIRDWYQQTLILFDNVVLPLSRQLENHLQASHAKAMSQAANRNRQMWKEQGKHKIEFMKDQFVTAEDDLY